MEDLIENTPEDKAYQILHGVEFLDSHSLHKAMYAVLELILTHEKQLADQTNLADGLVQAITKVKETAFYKEYLIYSVIDKLLTEALIKYQHRN